LNKAGLGSIEDWDWVDGWLLNNSSVGSLKKWNWVDRWLLNNSSVRSFKDGLNSLFAAYFRLDWSDWESWYNNWKNRNLWLGDGEFVGTSDNRHDGNYRLNIGELV
jgi:hypothetical protein